MKALAAFLRGAFEFRHTCTTFYADFGLAEWYDTGREWAHRLTFRRYDY